MSWLSKSDEEALSKNYGVKLNQEFKDFLDGEDIDSNSVLVEMASSGDLESIQLPKVAWKTKIKNLVLFESENNNSVQNLPATLFGSPLSSSSSKKTSSSSSSNASAAAASQQQEQDQQQQSPTTINNSSSNNQQQTNFAMQDATAEGAVLVGLSAQTQNIDAHVEKNEVHHHHHENSPTKAKTVELFPYLKYCIENEDAKILSLPVAEIITNKNVTTVELLLQIADNNKLNKIVSDDEPALEAKLQKFVSYCRNKKQEWEEKKENKNNNNNNNNNNNVFRAENVFGAKLLISVDDTISVDAIQLMLSYFSTTTDFFNLSVFDFNYMLGEEYRDEIMKIENAKKFLLKEEHWDKATSCYSGDVVIPFDFNLAPQNNKNNNNNYNHSGSDSEDESSSNNNNNNNNNKNDKPYYTGTFGINGVTPTLDKTILFWCEIVLEYSFKSTYGKTNLKGSRSLISTFSKRIKLLKDVQSVSRIKSLFDQYVCNDNASYFSASAAQNNKNADSLLLFGTSPEFRDAYIVLLEVAAHYEMAFLFWLFLLKKLLLSNRECIIFFNQGGGKLRTALSKKLKSYKDAEESGELYGGDAMDCLSTLEECLELLDSEKLSNNNSDDDVEDLTENPSSRLKKHFEEVYNYENNSGDQYCRDGFVGDLLRYVDDSMQFSSQIFQYVQTPVTINFFLLSRIDIFSIFWQMWSRDCVGGVNQYNASIDDYFYDAEKLCRVKKVLESENWQNIKKTIVDLSGGSATQQAQNHRSMKFTQELLSVTPKSPSTLKYYFEILCGYGVAYIIELVGAEQFIDKISSLAPVAKESPDTCGWLFEAMEKAIENNEKNLRSFAFSSKFRDEVLIFLADTVSRQCRSSFFWSRLTLSLTCAHTQSIGVDSSFLVASPSYRDFMMNEGNNLQESARKINSSLNSSGLNSVYKDQQDEYWRDVATTHCYNVLRCLC